MSHETTTATTTAGISNTKNAEQQQQQEYEQIDQTSCESSSSSCSSSVPNSRDTTNNDQVVGDNTRINRQKDNTANGHQDTTRISMESKETLTKQIESEAIESDKRSSTSSTSSTQSQQYYHQPPSEESVHQFYRQVIPALLASIPILLARMVSDLSHRVAMLGGQIWHFLIPSSSASSATDSSTSIESSASSSALNDLFQKMNNNNNTSPKALVDSIINFFDSNADGYITNLEIADVKEKLLHFEDVIAATLASQRQTIESKWKLFFQSWPMMDWKLGIFLWRTCGGLLLVLFVLSIIPGRFHRISGRILRWPVLALTYMMIAVELGVYVLLRLFIRLAETLVANPKHRRWRKEMEYATSYKQWYTLARKLDESKGRHKWQRSVNDELTSSRYNWSFVKELVHDLRMARNNNDTIRMLAVLQQCTRKNVGGIMSEDLFSYMQTGETKLLVNEFANEVVTSLHWITKKAHKTDKSRRQKQQQQEASIDKENELLRQHQEEHQYETKVQECVREEKEKLHTMLLHWACQILGDNDSDKNDDGGGESSSNDSKKKKREGKDNGDDDVADDKSGSTSIDSTDWDTGGGVGEGNSDRSLVKNAVDEAGKVPHEVPMEAQLPGGILLSSSCQRSMSGGSNDDGQPVPHCETVRLFLKRARAAYGRTALCLSGGGMMANYHYGVIRALLETDCLPNIISGTSAGSVIGSLICTRTFEELKHDLDPKVLQPKQGCFSRTWTERMKSIYQTGNMFDGNEWIDMIRWFANGDMTFEESYRKTGRVLCISVSATSKKAPPVLLNYISAPNVTIASAIIASAAVPGFIKPVRLRIKDPATGIVHVPSEKEGEAYWDGSIQQDIPIAGLSEMLNCQFFVASQCNPHLVPFFFNTKGDVGNPSRWSNNTSQYGGGAADNMDSWRGGFLLSALEMYVKNDMRAKMRFLDDVEAAVGFTSTMFTQSSYGGHTTIVPKVKLPFFLKVFTNPSLSDMEEYFQVGLTCAYPHIQMIKIHYAIARALDECLVYLEEEMDDEDEEEDDDAVDDEPRMIGTTAIEKTVSSNNKEGLSSSSSPRSTVRTVKSSCELYSSPMNKKNLIDKVRKRVSMSEKARTSYLAKEGGTNVSELPL